MTDGHDQYFVTLAIADVVSVVNAAVVLLILRHPRLWRRMCLVVRRGFRRRPIRTAQVLFVPLLSLFLLPVVMVGGESNRADPVITWVLMVAFVVFAAASHIILGRSLQRAFRKEIGTRRLVVSGLAVLHALGLVPALIGTFLVVGTVLAWRGFL